MLTYFTWAQIVLSVSLSILLLMQTQGGGLGGIFGQADTVYRTKRGMEKILFSTYHCLDRTVDNRLFDHAQIKLTSRQLFLCFQRSPASPEGACLRKRNAPARYYPVTRPACI